ncbi:hypothetical protein D3C71_2090170 [compost metagenome]
MLTVMAGAVTDTVGAPGLEGGFLTVLLLAELLGPDGVCEAVTVMAPAGRAETLSVPP